MYQKKRRQVGNRSKYVKIPMKTKLKFLRMVVAESFSVKDAAAIFKINYSTAKTLMRQYKLDALLYDLNASQDNRSRLQRCGYIDLKCEVEDKCEQSQSKTSLFYLQGGSNNEKQKRPISGVLSKIEIISCTNN